MNLKIVDQIALITGSIAGTGLAVVKTLAAEGARVIVNGRTAARVTGPSCSPLPARTARSFLRRRRVGAWSPVAAWSRGSGVGSGRQIN